MATLSKEIADAIIAGEYDEDECFKIVEYTNMEGKQVYGAMFKGDSPDRYHESEYVINPKVYWKKK